MYGAHASEWGLVRQCGCERWLEALRRGRVVQPNDVVATLSNMGAIGSLPVMAL